jgi:hypothetical protein
MKFVWHGGASVARPLLSVTAKAESTGEFDPLAALPIRLHQLKKGSSAVQ